MKKLIFLLLALFLFPSSPAFGGKVVKVVDGETFTMLVNNERISTMVWT